MSEALLYAKDIYKSFGPVAALKGVTMAVGRGEVVGLLGDNGAGKSTLAKILVGLYRPDKGEIYFEGRRVSFKSPRDARMHGIEIVYQDLALVEDLPIYRNLFLGREPRRTLGMLDIEAMKRETERLLSEIGINVRRPDDVVRRLSGGERQAIAIARAVKFGAKLVILDEPTAALSVKETEFVLDYIGKLKGKGISVIFITHNIFHVYTVADRFVILEHGSKIADLEKACIGGPEVIIDIIAQRLRPDEVRC